MTDAQQPTEKMPAQGTAPGETQDGPGDGVPRTAEAWPAAGPVEDTARRRQHRPSTIVWGLVITVIGSGILARALGAEFDNGLALIVLLAAAGVALLGTSIASAVRRR